MTVRLRCSSWPQLAALHKRDLSRGQLFLRTKKAPKPGTPLCVHLGLPSGSTIELTGIVSVVVGEDNRRGAGAVVALEPLSPTHRMTLEAALRALTEQTRRVTARRGEPVTPARKLPATKPSPVADTLSFEQGRELVAAEAELVGALQTELATFSKLNPFQILDVGIEADDEAVRVAFGELSKRYHPDRFVRYQSDVVSHLAEELFVRARNAFKRLDTESGRQQLLGEIRSNGKPTAPPPPAVRKITGRGRSPAITGKHSPAARRGDSVAAVIPSPAGLATAPTATAAGTQVPAIDRGSAHAATRHLGGERVRAALPKTSAVSQPKTELDPLVAYPDAEGLLAKKRFTDAAGLFMVAAKRDTESDAAKAGIELAEGLRALEAGDRLEAAQRFEAVLDLHPANEVAARELAKMRRRAVDQRKGLLTKLMKDQG